MSVVELWEIHDEGEQVKQRGAHEESGGATWCTEKIKGSMIESPPLNSTWQKYNPFESQCANHQ